jgi:uncharacterized protein YbcI
VRTRRGATPDACASWPDELAYRPGGRVAHARGTSRDGNETAMTVTDGTLAVSKSSAISKLAIRLMSRYTGRGPNKVRTYFNDDVITIVMRDLLTKPESSLHDNGETDLVLSMRKAFQDVMAGEFIAGIEDIMQREVIAFMSANSVAPDIAVETFVLAPTERQEADVEGEHG